MAVLRPSLLIYVFFLHRMRCKQYFKPYLNFYFTQKADKKVCICNKSTPGSTTRKLTLVTLFDKGRTRWREALREKKNNTAITDISVQMGLVFSEDPDFVGKHCHFFSISLTKIVLEQYRYAWFGQEWNQKVHLQKTNALNILREN